jgi:alpha-L-rhamnosidase
MSAHTVSADQLLRPNTTPHWISRPDALFLGCGKEKAPAPFLRRELRLTQAAESAIVKISGIGFYELRINGRKIGDHVLSPAVTRYDRRVLYLEHNVKNELRIGHNAIGVILGHGFYNTDYPRLWFSLEIDGKPVLESDSSWKVGSGPIIQDGLYSGEIYDAGREMDAWDLPGYDDSAWEKCALVAAPGGMLDRQTMPPCRVMRTLRPVSTQALNASATIYDFGQNLSGWARIAVTGEAGAKISLTYAERLDGSGDTDQREIAICGPKWACPGEDFQRDQYILKGGKDESWEPRFTYHGFQYVKAEISGKAEISLIEARVAHTAFASAGHFSCSSDVVNQLQECFRWSYVDNFVGLPTDCPHREKKGWTGDAQLTAEAGLFNYASASAYAQWLDSFSDVQRPSGQLPGIVPNGGPGFTWESGPGWDAAYVLIPWYLYLFTGDAAAIFKHYDSIKASVDYMSSRAKAYLVDYGLGDWLHPSRANEHPWKQPDTDDMVPKELVCSAYYHTCCKLLAVFAELTQHREDQSYYANLAENIRLAVNAKFQLGNGVYANGSMGAQAVALHHELVDPADKPATAARLAQAVEEAEYKAQLGVLSSKCALRALAENGYAGHAFKMLTQPEFPGWANWLGQGANTLWEQWDGSESRNHPVFGDFSAWLFQYLAGIAPDPKYPGFKHFTIHPRPVEPLNTVRASHACGYGKIKVEWRKTNAEFRLNVQVPPMTTATIILPDNTRQIVNPGNHDFRVSEFNAS